MQESSTNTRRSRLGLAPPGHGAPEWTTSQWFNTERALQVADLRGRVVVLHAFQMLCPGCVTHGLPQAKRVHAAFAADEVAVVGLHTVFEHHDAMTPVSLQAFLYEFRIDFPVGVDARAADPDDSIPVTMNRYALQGTPSLVLIDRRGQLRLQAFGAVDDLTLGAAIATLLAETA